VAVTAGAFDPGACVQIVRVGGRELAHDHVSPFDWERGISLAGDRTRLYPGDLVVGPACKLVEGLGPGDAVEIEVDGIGVLSQLVR
jgi:hypothetical protein